MPLNIEKLKKGIESAKELLLVVEGKKDKAALEKLGLSKIFVLNENSKSLPERVEELEKLAKNQKICILTDFDKKGKSLYLKLKSIISQMPIKMDNSFRHLILKSDISHIEGLDTFMENQERED